MKKSKIYLRLTLTVTLLLLPLAFPHKLVHADALEKVRDVIDDSRPTLDSSHEIYFVAVNGVAVDETIIFEFDDSGTDFNLTDIGFADIDLAEDNDDDGCDGTWDEKSLLATATASDWGVEVNTTTDIITFTAPSGGTPINANRCVQIEIGDNATGGVGNDEINNPAAGYYDVLISGTIGNNDTGTAKMVIIATITAQVSVSQTLTFAVAAQTPAECDNYDDGVAPNEITTTSILIDFATPAANTFWDGCQELTIDTNAAGGYSVTVQESDPLTYLAATIPNGSCDTGTPCSVTNADDWSTSSDNGFGYCMEDQSGDGATTEDAEWGTNGCDAVDTYFKIFGDKDDESPDLDGIMSSIEAANDVADIGYRLTVPGTQAAGTYQNNIILVATPTY